MNSISVALMTHNETVHFHWLMQALAPAVPLIEEIVVVDDFSEPECVAAIRSYEGRMPLRFFQRPLRKNFARQRNYMKSLCRGDFIFFLDPDELPSERIVLGLPKIVEMMARLDIDAYGLPRLNVVHHSDEPVHPGMLDLDDPKSRVHWEDQFRLLRNSPRLNWMMRLDEHLVGMRRCYRFPHIMPYALLHPKTVKHAEKQSKFYRSMRVLRRPSRMQYSIWKRLPWRTKIEWVATEPPV